MAKSITLTNDEVNTLIVIAQKMAGTDTSSKALERLWAFFGDEYMNYTTRQSIKIQSDFDLNGTTFTKRRGLLTSQYYEEFVKLIMNFDPTFGAPFMAFAKKRIDGQLMTDKDKNTNRNKDHRTSSSKRKKGSHIENSEQNEEEQYEEELIDEEYPYDSEQNEEGEREAEQNEEGSPCYFEQEDDDDSCNPRYNNEPGDLTYFEKQIQRAVSKRTYLKDVLFPENVAHLATYNILVKRIRRLIGDRKAVARYFDILVKLDREGGNTSDANISIIMNCTRCNVGILRKKLIKILKENDFLI